MPILKPERQNLPRWNLNQKPFIESYDITCLDRLNEQSFWFRFQLINPKIRAAEAMLIGMFFDSKNPQQNRFHRLSIPIEEVHLERNIFYLALRSCALFHSGTRGELQSHGEKMTWELKIHEAQDSLNPFPFAANYLPWISVKRNIPQHLCHVSGEVTLGERSIHLDSLPANQYHSWGKIESCPSLWAGCTGFQEDPNGYFEGCSFEQRIGMKKRLLTLFKLRCDDKDYSLPAPWNWWRAKSRFDVNRWTFEATKGKIRIVGDITGQERGTIAFRSLTPQEAPCFHYCSSQSDLKIEIYEMEKAGQGKLLKTLTSKKSTFVEVTRPNPDPKIRFFV
ncbi:MAG: hypothetical protein HY539_03450 [Deltaproteobacteria bacterium]|nr:hypothetical protein [Deltaproteobacteria bacterium]